MGKRRKYKPALSETEKYKLKLKQLCPKKIKAKGEEAVKEYVENESQRQLRKVYRKQQRAELLRKQRELFNRLQREEELRRKTEAKKN